MAAANASNQNDRQTVWHRKLLYWIYRNIFWVLLSLLAAILIGVWAFYALDYSYKTISQGIFILPDDIGRIYYPEHLLLFSESSPLQVNFTREPTQPLSVTLHFPNSIQAQVSPTMTNRMIVLNVAPNQTITNTIILLQNAGLWNGLRGKDEKIQVTITDEEGNKQEPLREFTIRLEGRQNAIWRQFVASTVNQNSPFILAGIALIALTRVYLDYQEKRHKEHREKVQALISDLRRFWRAGNLNEAIQTWQSLKDEPFTDASLKQLASICEAMLQLLNQSQDDGVHVKSKIEQVTDSYYPELAGILTYVAQAHYNNNRNRALDGWFKKLQADFRWQVINDTTQSDALWRALRRLDPSDFQGWRLEPDDDNVTGADRLAGTDLATILGLCTPMAHINAENEPKTLTTAYYWSNQVVWLRDVSVSHVIYGVPGCGRTALGLQLCELRRPESESTLFSLYVRTRPDVPQLKKNMAYFLLEYLGKKPLLALGFNDAIRRQCLRLLNSEIAPDFILGRFANYRTNPDQWLEGANSEQKPIWKMAGLTQLDLLSSAMSEIALEERPLDHESWLRGWLQCVQAWGLRGLHLVVDATAEDNIEAVITKFHQELFHWGHVGLIVTLLLPVPEADLDALSQQLRRLNISHQHLAWSSEELMRMVEHRITKICQVEDATVRWTKCFDREETMHHFITAAAGNPQRLVKLWHECLRQLENSTFITSAVVEQAQNNL